MARVTKVSVGYNVQLAVDTRHKLIAEQEVTNQVLDMGLLAPTAMETLNVETIEVVADEVQVTSSPRPSFLYYLAEVRT